MKNTKVLSLLSVAVFLLTGCKKQCSKDEFINLANKVEKHQYAKATATCKGKVSTKTNGINESYEPNDTFNFIYKNGEWTYDGDASSLKAFRQSLILSCSLIMSLNVKDLLNQDPFLTEGDREGLTCYSSPLGFNYKATYDNAKQDTIGYAATVNGSSETTYTFDNNNGAILEYIEKSDLDLEMNVNGTPVNTKSVTDLTLNFSYSD